MPSQNLRKIFNQALIDPRFTEELFMSFEQILIRYEVPEKERVTLLRHPPRDIDEFAQYISSKAKKITEGI